MNCIENPTSTQKLGNCSMIVAAQAAKAMIRLELRNYFIIHLKKKKKKKKNFYFFYFFFFIFKKKGKK